MSVAIVNYGVGNLGSVRRAFEDLGASVAIVDSPARLDGASYLVLPGVGAFSEGMTRLRAGGWVEPLRDQVIRGRKPILGICLGMQMLAATGDEGGISPGLGLIDGCVRRLDALGCTLRIPHVGWNEVTFTTGEPLFAHIPQNSDFYFVHSYALDLARSQDLVARTAYEVTFAAGVRSGHVMGTQFHPEKSSRAGRQLLRNFLDCASC
ncbi:MAG TPA: imidazole glycerol phosphate synthase subunit HisH [Steroidobacteraceae bacterium]|nr:imidazole glycerol phosphate synthase subunit HisH [Steroidobacteraceae bacterium]